MSESPSERMGVVGWPRYIRCADCHAHWRIEALSPSVGPSMAKYCPMCGKAQVVGFDRDLDYWYIMAESLGFSASAKGVALTKGLYDLWEPSKHTHFFAFVRETLKEHAS